MKLLGFKAFFAEFRRSYLPAGDPVRRCEDDAGERGDRDRADEHSKELADRAGDFPHAPVRWGNFR